MHRNTSWGGMIYESYNLPKESPTVGMFFIAKDYIEFLSDLKGYVNGKLTFISPTKSRWKDIPQISEDKRFGSYPVGVLSNGKNSIEIFFLHYHSEQEVREKWERRVKRINWNKLLVKFKWKNKINIVLYKEKNAGPAMSFWQLLMKSEVKADYYAFCDQDDVWDKDKIEKGIEKLKGSIQLYACNCRIIDEKDVVIKKNRVSGIPNMDVQNLFISGCTQGCSMIFTDSLRNYIKSFKLNIHCIC